MRMVLCGLISFRFNIRSSSKLNSMGHAYYTRKLSSMCLTHRLQSARTSVAPPNRQKVEPLWYNAACFQQSMKQYSTANVDIEEYIKHNTEITREHLTPEVALHLITPRCSLWHSKGEECPLPDPFWAFYWPGGQALTRYILDNGSEFAGETVLDVGSGCGASSIAAKMVGAKQVIANDICEVAAKAIEMNAGLNNVTFTIDTDNLIGQQQESWDTLLFGDMFYDEEFTNHIALWIKSLQTRPRTILIGDPGRIYFNKHKLKDNLELVYKCDLAHHTKEENNGLTQGYVWKYTI